MNEGLAGFWGFLPSVEMTTRLLGAEGEGSGGEAAASFTPSFFTNACHSERSEESFMRLFEMHPMAWRVFFVWGKVLFLRRFFLKRRRCMSTLSITVEDSSQALMLADWLRNIRFVREVNIHHNRKSSGNVRAVQRVLDTIKADGILSNIADPVAYQKTIRDEWD